jgi:hypothetical protein
MYFLLYELFILAMVGRLIIVYAMNAASQLSLEVVPTQLRGMAIRVVEFSNGGYKIRKIFA